MHPPKWMERLKNRWHLQSLWQVVIILVVFACTGFTVLALKRPLLSFLAGGEAESTLASVLYYIFILPIYNVFLLAYGFLFGQFRFFWEFEKRSFDRIFRKRKK
jgi:Na+-driven multidrug efflux pump